MPCALHVYFCLGKAAFVVYRQAGGFVLLGLSVLLFEPRPWIHQRLGVKGVLLLAAQGFTGMFMGQGFFVRPPTAAILPPLHTAAIPPPPSLPPSCPHCTLPPSHHYHHYRHPTIIWGMQEGQPMFLLRANISAPRYHVPGTYCCS